VRNASARCAAAFEPADLRVTAGATVQFRNDDWEVHTVVSGIGEDPCNLHEVEQGERVIDLGQLPPGVALTQTFREPGVYRYMCHLPGHHMAGVITVEP
jgi:plastocyanin